MVLPCAVGASVVYTEVLEFVQDWILKGPPWLEQNYLHTLPGVLLQATLFFGAQLLGGLAFVAVGAYVSTRRKPTSIALFAILVVVFARSLIPAIPEGHELLAGVMNLLGGLLGIRASLNTDVKLESEAYVLPGLAFSGILWYLSTLYFNANPEWRSIPFGNGHTIYMPPKFSFHNEWMLILRVILFFASLAIGMSTTWGGATLLKKALSCRRPGR